MIDLKYELECYSPKDFYMYHEVHLPAHFLFISSLKDEDKVGADREDM
jgi:hypothetical protein